MESFNQDEKQMFSQLMFLVSELESLKKKYKKLKITHSTCELDITNLKKESMFLALKNKKLELELAKFKDLPKLNVDDMYVQHDQPLDQPLYQPLDQTTEQTPDKESVNDDNVDVEIPPKPLPRDHPVDLIPVVGTTHNITGSTLLRTRGSLNKITDDQILEPVKTFKPANNITESTILRKRSSLKKVDIQKVEEEKDQFKKEDEVKNDYGYLVNAIQSRRPITDSITDSLVQSWID